jgi:hypothetical protein
LKFGIDEPSWSAPAANAAPKHKPTAATVASSFFIGSYLPEAWSQYNRSPARGRASIFILKLS